MLWTYLLTKPSLSSIGVCSTDYTISVSLPWLPILHSIPLRNQRATRETDPVNLSAPQEFPGGGSWERPRGASPTRKRISNGVIAPNGPWASSATRRQTRFPVSLLDLSTVCSVLTSSRNRPSPCFEQESTSWIEAPTSPYICLVFAIALSAVAIVLSVGGSQEENAGWPHCAGAPAG